jgi:hypothetical protein
MLPSGKERAGPFEGDGTFPYENMAWVKKNSAKAFGAK